MTYIELVAFEPRRRPDPTFEIGNASLHQFHLNVLDVPAAGFSLDPNPRKPATKVKDGKNLNPVHKGIQDSLLNRDLDATEKNTFHLKNKGILLFAQSVDVDEAETDRRLKAGTLRKGSKVLRIGFKDDSTGQGDGLLDGGHTYTLILGAQEQIRKLNEKAKEITDGYEVSEYQTPIDQYVDVTVMVGYPPELEGAIASGRNTGIQVTKSSLMNSEGEFDWIKDALQKTSFANRIAFYEGDESDCKKSYHVRDILAIINLLNVRTYPVDLISGGKTPNMSYNQKEAVLEEYASSDDKRKAFQAIAPILADALKLLDIVNRDVASLIYESLPQAEKDLFQDTRVKGAIKGKSIDDGVKFWTQGALLDSYAKAVRTNKEFVFLGEKGKFKLNKAPLYAVFQTMRTEIKDAGDDGYAWNGTFDDVLAQWELRKQALTNQLVEWSTDEDTRVTPSVLGIKKGYWQRLVQTSLLTRQK